VGDQARRSNRTERLSTVRPGQAPAWSFSAPVPGRHRPLTGQAPPRSAGPRHWIVKSTRNVAAASELDRHRLPLIALIIQFWMHRSR
jgi:hypothetical protein